MQGQLLGTPAYMAPEQAEGRQHQTDCRTDVYGLGAILYEILTGQPPFHARTTTELLKKVRQDPPGLPRQINHQVAPGIAGDLPEGPGQGAGKPLCLGHRAGPGRAALSRRRAGIGLSRATGRDVRLGGPESIAPPSRPRWACSWRQRLPSRSAPF